VAESPEELYDRACGSLRRVWFIARPERLPQLKGSFVAIWDDILPPLPRQLWRANLDTVAAALRE
jgi:hypothetical protein